MSLLLGVATAQAQSTLVSNTGQSSTDASVVGYFASERYEHAASFTTGGDADGYTLAEVGVALTNIASAAIPRVSIYTTTSSGLPHTSLHVLSNPASVTANAVNTFTAASGATLDANTTYAVVLQNTQATSNYVVSATSSTAEDSGAASGWSIGNQRAFNNVSGTDGWTATDGSLRIAIKGYSNSLVPKFSSATLTGDYKVTVNFDKDLKPGNCPGIYHWTVSYNGPAERPIYVACYTRSVVLHSRSHNQSPSLAEHRTVTVSYRPQSIGARLRSVEGAEVASFSNRPVRNEYPLLSGASVNGKVLTLTYDQPLDAGSVPPGSAFSLGVSGGALGAPPPPQPSVVRTAVSGNAVTVTLDVAVAHDKRMSVGYVPPASNPIRNPDGGEAKAITWRDYLTVRVLTPDNGVAPTFYSANLIHDRYASETRLQVNFDEGLDGDSLPAGSAFRVTAKPRSGGSARTVAGTGTVRLQSAAVVSLTLAQQVDPDAIVTVSYVKPSANPLRGSDGNDLESFTNQPVNNGAPEILSVKLSSNAGPDRTYARGDKVQVQVTFSSPVEVRGTPRQRLNQGRSHPEKSPARGGYYYPWAEYESGSGTRTLTFAYTVKELDRSNGVAVIDRAWSGGALGGLELNGGAIRSVWLWPHHNADLSHPQLWLPYNSAHKVDGSLKEKTFFESAAVNGKALTVTFDETLDTGSVPAPGAFYVTVNGAQRNVAAGGVAISGKTVTLTLASAVGEGDTVKVRYTKPSTKPLQSTSRKAVDTFSDRAVTNNSVRTIWSATLELQQISSIIFGCDGGGSARCSNALTANNFVHGGETYQVTRIVFQEVHIDWIVSITLDKAWPQALRSTATWHVGSLELSLADGGYDDAGRTVGWFPQGNFPSFSGGQNVSLRLRASPGGSSGAGGNSGGPEPASVTGVSVVSSAGADKTYGDGDRIEVRATFDGPVDVTGTPRIKIDMDPAHWGEKWAVYEEGGGTTSLTFVHTVEEPNLSTRGIAVVANSLERNGGTIRSGGNDANLAHDGLGHDANHKVDWQAAGEESGAGGTGGGDGPGGLSGDSGPPSVTGVSVVSSPASGATYLLGEKIGIRVAFDQAVSVTGNPKLSIDMDPAHWGTKQAAYESGGGTSSLTFVHTVVEPNLSTQGIAVLANTLALNGGTIRSTAGTNAVLGHTGLGHDSGHKVDWRPEISVADARANEGAGASVAFEVSLDRAFTSAEHSVTVDYATSDGSAKAGEDYTATSGTLTFAAGEKTKTVNVPVLDDAVDEGEETFTFRLSNASGGRIGDGEATGTIANDDPLQKMWLSRFGRTVASHLTDAVSDRLANPLSGAQVTVGGQRVDLAATQDGEAVAQALAGFARALGAREAPGPEGEEAPGGWLGERGAGWNDATAASAPRRMTGRELLLGSAFHLAREGDGGDPSLAAWGRVTVGGFDGEAPADDGTVRIDGDVTTGILGADAEWNRLLAGVAVSLSEGEGTFAQPGVDSGTIESSLTTVSPYARLRLSERVSAWGLVGFGTGDMTIVQDANERGRAERVTRRTDIEMRMGAVGGRGALLEADETGGIDLALKADAFYVETEAEAVSNEGNTTADASRVRLALEGSRSFETGGGGVLTPGLELGVRHDDGDAETGTGVELGGRVSWADADSGLSMEARVRTLVAHEDSGYEEWGASGAVRLDPGASGRGLSFSVAPTWGVASSGVDRLWSARDAQGLAPDGEFEPERRLDAELGYGLAAFGGRFTGTPNLGLGLSDGVRDWRLGWRLTPAAQDRSGFELNLDAIRRESANDDEAPEHGVMLRGAIRW